MILIIGGAYQGKLDHAKEKYNIKDDDVFDCKVASGDGTQEISEIDFSKKCVYGIEEFTYSCVQKGIEPQDYFEAHEEEWRDSILICEDIFCGVVPLGADMREWRQATGRLCKYLSHKSERVSRIFCGVEQELKKYI